MSDEKRRYPRKLRRAARIDEAFRSDRFVEGMMNIQAHPLKIKPQQVYLYRIAAEFVFDLCVLDAVVGGLEILSGKFTDEYIEGTDGENQKSGSGECSFLHDGTSWAGRLAASLPRWFGQTSIIILRPMTKRINERVVQLNDGEPEPKGRMFCTGCDV